MSKYTLKTIKDTAIYKANIKAVAAIYPGHEEDFAHELLAVANSNLCMNPDAKTIATAFHWESAPQGHNCWSDLYHEIFRYEMIGKRK